MSAAIGLAILALVAACLFAVGAWLFWWAFKDDDDDLHRQEWR